MSSDDIHKPNFFFLCFVLVVAYIIFTKPICLKSFFREENRPNPRARFARYLKKNIKIFQLAVPFYKHEDYKWISSLAFFLIDLGCPPILLGGSISSQRWQFKVFNMSNLPYRVYNMDWAFIGPLNSLAGQNDLMFT